MSQPNIAVKSVDESFPKREVFGYSATPFSEATVALLPDGLDLENSTWVEVDDSCHEYRVLCRYVHHLSKKKKQRAAASLTVSRSSGDRDYDDDESDDKDPIEELKKIRRDRLNKKQMPPKKVKLRLGLGVHTVELKDKLLHVLHQSFGVPRCGVFGAGLTTKRNIVIFAHELAQESMIKKFIDEAVVWDHTPSSSKTVQIYHYSVSDMYWELSVSKRSRPLETIILPKKIKNNIIDALGEHLSEWAIDWYAEHGIPFKFSMLFHGAPGTGKTSFIQALAGHFGMNLCYLQPTGHDFKDKDLNIATRMVPKNSIIVIEDVDALFGKHREKSTDDRSEITFSGLLNALDGVATPPGLVLILTTNYIDKLDSGLIRQGRVDMHVEFPNPDRWALQEMFKSFYPTFFPYQENKDRIKSKNNGRRASESSSERETSSEICDEKDEKSALRSEDQTEECPEKPNGIGGINSDPTSPPESNHSEAAPDTSTGGSNNVSVSGKELKALLKDLSEKFSSEWRKKYKSTTSMCVVQQHFIRCMRKNARECVAAVEDSHMYLVQDNKETLYQ